MDLIYKLEELRAATGETKTEMGAHFGVVYQNYNNWVARGSLPKEHYKKAQEMLQKTNDPSGYEAEANEIIRNLTPEGRDAALQSLRSIEALDKR